MKVLIDKNVFEKLLNVAASLPWSQVNAVIQEVQRNTKLVEDDPEPPDDPDEKDKKPDAPPPPEKRKNEHNGTRQRSEETVARSRDHASRI